MLRSPSQAWVARVLHCGSVAMHNLAVTWSIVNVFRVVKVWRVRSSKCGGPGS